ncbi:hypothetical protein RUE5091_01825 [Ruegeria denitrificans]|uniref:Uncharacterized protein n=1 Tax=Ruegeria denitrificans TaxID=1715692 RepID=A0A0P1I8F0_9RHOB|nr:hypothetical protein RUE5091_01825 [Ruegeria denitrificans]
MPTHHERFTMSFRQSCACGIDYREFERVDSLPIGIPLVAIAGVWGDCYNLRCLFMDTDGNQYLRNVFRTKNGYLIPELGVDAKMIKIGQVVLA